MIVFLKVLSRTDTSILGTFSKISVLFPLKTFYFSERKKYTDLSSSEIKKKKKKALSGYNSR